MSGPHQFRITSGVFALAPVGDTDPDGWQTPGGEDIMSITVDDYLTVAGIEVSCQVTSGTLTPSPNTTDDVTPATLCQAEVTTTIVGVTSFTLDVTYIPDEDIVGASAFLYDNDTKLAYFYLGLDGDGAAPSTVGRCRVVAAQFGGDPQVTRTVDVSLPVDRRPDIWWAGSTVSYGGGAPAATGATAGSPGSFTPAGAAPPANLAAMTGIVATPATAWTTGQHVVLGDASHCHWDGAAWVAGDAP